ncbi:hypothetical protein [Pantoea ananatis]|nr:hypothetical protein [Pantoea ananatis]
MIRLEDALMLVKLTTETLGTIDILIKNAGLMLFSAWSDIV